MADSLRLAGVTHSDSSYRVYLFRSVSALTQPAAASELQASIAPLSALGELPGIELFYFENVFPTFKKKHTQNLFFEKI